MVKFHKDSKLEEAIVLESVSWRRPGILEVVVSRLSPAGQDGVNPEIFDIPLQEVGKYVDGRLIGKLHAVQVDRVGDGVFKVSHIYKKIFTQKDDRTFAIRSGVERISLHLAPFIDQIMEKYMGWQHPATREIQFPKTIPKKHLKEKKPLKNPYGEPWTGHDWPELSDMPGHINNPFHGVRLFIAPFSEITIEEGRVGTFSFEEVEMELGWASSPPSDTGFAFLSDRARGQNVIMSDNTQGKIKPQERWIVVNKSMRQQGEDVSISTTWRSKKDPGWPGPVYRRGF